MGWNTPGDTKRTVPLVVGWDRPNGDKEHVSFPGGIDKSVSWLFNYCILKAVDLGYPPRDGWCYGYCLKKIAGTDVWSFHAKGGGRAIDFNAPENGRGTRGEIPMKVVEVFERNGFTWGGRWDYTDPMHFEAGKSRLWYFRRTRYMKRQVRKNRG